MQQISAELRNGWTSIEGGWKDVFIPQQDCPAPDALDLATRFDVLEGNNYSPSPEWKEVISKTSLGLTSVEARNAVIEALGETKAKGARLPQRKFVRNLVVALRSRLSETCQKQLRDAALKMAHPRDVGIVAVAVGIKEAAKPEIIEIKSGEVTTIELTGSLRNDSETAWLHLI